MASAEECEEVGQQQLLTAARNNELEQVRELLTQPRPPNVNCKGKSKSNLGWSPLHLAAYFGHKDVVHLLLEGGSSTPGSTSQIQAKYGADVDITNDIGDTPLQRAAHTGRLDVVLLLLQYNADTSIQNSEGQTALSLARNPEVRRVIEGAQSAGLKRAEQHFLKSARDGDTEALLATLKQPRGVSINCTDSFGNTALHLATYQGHKEIVITLLQNAIDPSLCNDKGQRAADLARTVQMRQVLEVKPIRELQRGAQRYEGLILKKSKLLGWKSVWVVLERGVLNFFKNRADASTGTHRKMSKYLDGAKVEPKSDEAHIFYVKLSDGTTATLAVEPTASAGINRQKWQNAINDHIACANHYTARDTDSDDEEMKDIVPLASMTEALQSATAHQQLLEKQVNATNTSISTLTENNVDDTKKQVSLLQVRLQLAQISETSQHMVGALSHCLTLLTQQEELRKLQLAQEAEKSRVLQEALHVLAEEHHTLEQSLHVPTGRSGVGSGGGGGEGPGSGGGGHRSSSIMIDSDDDQFFDCDNTSDDRVNGASNSYSPTKRLDATNSGSDSDQFEAAQSEDTDQNGGQGEEKVPSTGTIASCIRLPSPIYGRTRLPAVCFSRNDFSIWSILKQCIGKELSKITMPVIFNEPLSFLQRIVEYMEYATLLQKANDCDDPIKRLEYVTAFAVSATASNWERIGKPFNPLLGETYELVREDLGFRIVSEQVSHHPPVSAFHAESDDYTFHGAIHPKLKFWGKSVEVTPKGIVTVELRKHGEVYTWQNVNCCVHNIIVGKLWIELYGAMEVLNHKTKHKAVLNFKPSGWFGKDLHKIEGFIYDENKKKQRALYGKWVEGLYSYNLDVWESYNRSGGREHISEGDVPGKGSTCNLNLPNQRVLWLAHERSEDSAKYYNFSLFAMMLNETTDGLSIPPNDCRLRPDLRKLEEGDIDGAGAEKHRLEEKQRAARKERKKRKEEWKPRWFYMDTNPHTGKEDWLFNKGYWEHKYEGCPDIF